MSYYNSGRDAGNPDSGGGKTADICGLIAVIVWVVAILSMIK